MADAAVCEGDAVRLEALAPAGLSKLVYPWPDPPTPLLLTGGAFRGPRIFLGLPGFNRDQALEPHAAEKCTDQGEKRGSDPDRSHHGAPQNLERFLGAGLSVSSRRADGTEDETVRCCSANPRGQTKSSIFRPRISACSTPNTGCCVNLRPILGEKPTFAESSKTVKLVLHEGCWSFPRKKYTSSAEPDEDGGDAARMGTSPLPPSLSRFLRSRTTLILLPARWHLSASEE